MIYKIPLAAAITLIWILPSFIFAGSMIAAVVLKSYWEFIGYTWTIGLPVILISMLNTLLMLCAWVAMDDKLSAEERMARTFHLTAMPITVTFGQ